ncbi:hypothetical protein L6452_06336 [Arctium lappa]|uniref:Uncharacterized protein n=1 Tax=Arctium lappa TaxID=4217 RepID=A0ACB9EIL4_ARCLA|nr:hypothetical protein L6452_06336 [Arctium lappa]
MRKLSTALFKKERNTLLPYKGKDLKRKILTIGSGITKLDSLWNHLRRLKTTLWSMDMVKDMVSKALSKYKQEVEDQAGDRAIPVVVATTEEPTME